MRSLKSKIEIKMVQDGVIGMTKAKASSTLSPQPKAKASSTLSPSPAAAARGGGGGNASTVAQAACPPGAPANKAQLVQPSSDELSSEVKPNTIPKKGHKGREKIQATKIAKRGKPAAAESGACGPEEHAEEVVPASSSEGPPPSKKPAGAEAAAEEEPPKKIPRRGKPAAMKRGKPAGKPPATGDEDKGDSTGSANGEPTGADPTEEEEEEEDDEADPTQKDSDASPGDAYAEAASGHDAAAAFDFAGTPPQSKVRAAPDLKTAQKHSKDGDQSKSDKTAVENVAPAKDASSQKLMKANPSKTYQISEYPAACGKPRHRAWVVGRTPLLGGGWKPHGC